MTSVATPSATVATRGRGTPTSRWSAYAIAVWVGGFVVIVTGLLVTNHVIGGQPADAVTAIVVFATALRALTVGFALATVQSWGRRLPPPVLTMALWGSAAAQLFYPVAETIIRTLVAAEVLDLGSSGLADTSLTGWLHSIAVWAVFGIPGALFVHVGLSFQRRRAVGPRWAWTGAILGLLFFLAIGLIIG